MKIVLIEGPVGAGKTTFLNKLKDLYVSDQKLFPDKNLIFLEEPLDVINHCGDYNALQVLQATRARPD